MTLLQPRKSLNARQRERCLDFRIHRSPFSKCIFRFQRLHTNTVTRHAQSTNVGESRFPFINGSSTTRHTRQGGGQAQKVPRHVHTKYSISQWETPFTAGFVERFTVGYCMPAFDGAGWSSSSFTPCGGSSA